MLRTWTQAPRLYDDGNGNHWWPHPSTFDFERGSNDTSQADRLMAAMFGRRSDDKLFFVSTQVPLTADAESKAWAVEKAMKKIETFLDDRCECEKGRICDWHTKHYCAVIEEGDQIPQC